MTVRESIEILELCDEKVITLEIIKKRFRKLAHRYHPDKYELETEKLKKTKLFIEVKQAYDELMKQVSDSSSMLNPFFTETIAVEEAINTSDHNDTSRKARSKKSRIDVLDVLGWCSLPFGLFPLVYFMGGIFLIEIGKDVIREAKESLFGVLKLVLAVLFQIIPLILAGIYGLVIIWEKTFIENTFLGFIAFIQSSLIIIIWVWTFALRKILEKTNGINYELINFDVNE